MLVALGASTIAGCKDWVNTWGSQPDKPAATQTAAPTPAATPTSSATPTSDAALMSAFEAARDEAVDHVMETMMAGLWAVEPTPTSATPTPIATPKSAAGSQQSDYFMPPSNSTSEPVMSTWSAGDTADRPPHYPPVGQPLYPDLGTLPPPPQTHTWYPKGGRIVTIAGAVVFDSDPPTPLISNDVMQPTFPSEPLIDTLKNKPPSATAPSATKSAPAITPTPTGSPTPTVPPPAPSKGMRPDRPSVSEGIRPDRPPAKDTSSDAGKPAAP